MGRALRLDDDEVTITRISGGGRRSFKWERASALGCLSYVVLVLQRRLALNYDSACHGQMAVEGSLSPTSAARSWYPPLPVNKKDEQGRKWSRQDQP